MNTFGKNTFRNTSIFSEGLNVCCVSVAAALISKNLLMGKDIFHRNNTWKKTAIIGVKAKTARDLTANPSALFMALEKSCNSRTEYSTNRDRIAGEMVPDIAAITLMVMLFEEI